MCTLEQAAEILFTERVDYFFIASASRPVLPPALLNRAFQLGPVCDKLQLRESRLLAHVDHASQSLWRGVRQDVNEVRGDGLGPNGNRSAKTLQPQLAPVLTQGSWQKFEVAENLEPFVEIEFEILWLSSENATRYRVCGI